MDQVHKAYQERVERLKLSDYSDDPEYVSLKLAELRNAMNAITGGRFTGQVKTAKTSAARSVNENREQGTPVDTLTAVATKVADRAKTATQQEVIIGFAGLVFLIILMTGMIGSCRSMGYDDSYDYYQSEAYEEFQENMEKIASRAESYDYMDNLGKTDHSAKVDYDVGDSDVYVENAELADALGIDDLEALITGLTSDEDFYWVESDYEISKVLMDFVKAPGYETVAGHINKYTGDPITDYRGYMQYIIAVVESENER